MHRFRSLLLVALAALLLASPTVVAQTALTTTTLSGTVAVTDQVITVASVTSISASTTSLTNYLLIDREILAIRINGVTTATKQIQVTRGLSPGVRQTGHASGTTVYYIPGGTNVLSQFDRAGACSTSGSSDFSQDGSYAPVINPQTGSFFQCVSGVWQRGDMTGTFAGGQAAAHVFTTGSAYTNASTTFSSVTGLSFAARANQNYAITCYIVWQGSASTTGPKYQWTGPSSPTNIYASMWSNVTTSTFLTAVATAFSSAMANSGTVTATTNFVDILTVGLINGSNSGTVQLQAAANGAGTLTIQPGSRCLVQ